MVYVPPNTLYGPRSYRGRFLRVRWPNQQCQALKDNSWSFLHLKYSYKCNICELQSHQPHREIGTKKERNKVYKVSYKPKPYSSIPRHLANVDESRFWYAKWTYWQCNLDLWPFKPKTISLLGYPKVIPYTKLASLNTLGSIGFCLFELCSRQTNTQTDRQTDRRNQTSYPRRPTLSACMVTTFHYYACCSHVRHIHTDSYSSFHYRHPAVE